MESDKRKRIREKLGHDYEREDQMRNQYLSKERERVAKKEAKREALMGTLSYRIMDKTATIMDKFYLDAIIGLLFPGVGDVISSVLVIPFIYFALVYIHSIPLTLAVIANSLKDTLLGCIPFGIGDLIDFFYKSNVKNLKLITGYVNDDKEIIHKVDKMAFWSVVFIIILCVLIYFMVKFAIWFVQWLISLIGSLF